MEINPRLWGSLALAIDAGVDFPRGLLALAQGRNPGKQPPFRVSYCTRSLSHDIDWYKQNLRANHDDPLRLTVPLGRVRLEPLRLFTGRESWDHFNPRDPKVGWAILATVVNENWATVRRKLARWVQRLRLTWRHKRLFGPGGRSPETVRSVLMLCYGNICRSPVAALAARSLLGGHTVVSAGLDPREGRKRPEHVLLAARKLGLALAGHRSRRLKDEDVEKADLILVMDFENLDALLAEYPAATRKTTLLGLFDPEAPEWSIPDPYLLGDGGAELVLSRVQRVVRGLAEWLGATTSGSPSRGQLLR